MISGWNLLMVLCATIAMCLLARGEEERRFFTRLVCAVSAVIVILCVASLALRWLG